MVSGFPQALYRLGSAVLLDSALVSHARTGQPDLATVTKLARFGAEWRAPRFPLKGGDLVARGLSPSPEVGALLAELEAWWIAADFSPTRRQCLEELDRRLGR
jgi:poly(A) polymerase